jgi:hypothetical protein
LRNAGVNRVIWDLRHERLPARPGSRNGPEGPLVVPGRYTVRLTVDGRTSEQPVEVREDPRMPVSAAIRTEWTRTLLDIADTWGQAVEVLRRWQPIAERLRPDAENALPGDAREEAVRAIAKSSPRPAANTTKWSRFALQECALLTSGTRSDAPM